MTFKVNLSPPGSLDTRCWWPVRPLQVWRGVLGNDPVACYVSLSVPVLPVTPGRRSSLLPLICDSEFQVPVIVHGVVVFGLTLPVRVSALRLGYNLLLGNIPPSVTALSKLGYVTTKLARGILARREHLYTPSPGPIRLGVCRRLQLDIVDSESE